MRRLISAAAAIAALFCVNTVYADDVNNVYLNGSSVDFVKTGFSYSEVMLPARTLFEAAGFTVQWFEEDQRVTAFNSDFNITMFAEDNHIYINKIGYSTSEKMSIVNGAFSIPLKAAAQALDAVILYEDDEITLTSSIAVDTSGWAYDTFVLINEEREENGLSPLIWNSKLAGLAEQHCTDMMKRNYFSHYTPEGFTPFDRMRQYGINYSAAAENLAAGQPTPESVVKAWMESDGHRDNILNPELKEAGIAFVRGGEYGIYWAQEFATTK